MTIRKAKTAFASISVAGALLLAFSVAADARGGGFHGGGGGFHGGGGGFHGGGFHGGLGVRGWGGYGYGGFYPQYYGDYGYSGCFQQVWVQTDYGQQLQWVNVCSY